MCNALNHLLDDMFIRFDLKLYRQSVDIPMVTDYAPIDADLVLFCYEKAVIFMLSVSYNNQSDVIGAFNSTQRDLDDLQNIDNPYFEQIVG